MTEKYYSPKEVAFIAGLTTKSVYRWVDEGFICNAIRCRRRVLIPASEVERVIPDLLKLYIAQKR